MDADLIPEPPLPAKPALIDNQDATAEEFESHELNREKVIPAKAKLPVFIGPLAPGRYPFFGDFHKQTANGVIIAE